MVIKVGKNKATDTEAAKALEKPAEEASAKIAEEKQEPAAPATEQHLNLLKSQLFQNLRWLKLQKILKLKLKKQ
ncbi:hypothetical protein [Lactobacillus helveticus]|uniref:Uncharacterized protein n=1 Tax=Lactobacillus helveticus TaxID=1587 RepID=A0A9Q5G8J3_LACHE|nr:hypothetical protein [Lactobacillus helveticus]NRN89342.1 hypothetical protein [Lactobacillus helveticus]NRN93645.1 hypothetical protein [Lactobacillus helveticus]NRO35235.1 hypothetical protein [Lactobacillus helveticus]NRO54504.1 hypothetical protein [Lactobacillus helveticus]NRO58513.1 hypothetical protein [Lactobacillus helveticus]